MMLVPKAIRSLDERSSNNMSCALPMVGLNTEKLVGLNTEKLVGLNPEEVGWAEILDVQII